MPAYNMLGKGCQTQRAVMLHCAAGVVHCWPLRQLLPFNWGPQDGLTRRSWVEAALKATLQSYA
jgi:hypothetical protein